MDFSVNRTGNLSIENNRLSSQDYQAIQELGRAVKQAVTSLIGVGQRSQQLAGQLLSMAQQQGMSVRRSGEHYNLAVDPDGNIEIAARDGRGVIFRQISQENQSYVMADRLTPKDLEFFEKQLQSSQAQRQTDRNLAQQGGLRR